MSSISLLATHQHQEMMGEETRKLYSYVLENISESLPKGHSLEMIASAQSVALFRSNESHIVQLEKFTKAEWRLFLALCRAYPHYCSYDTLFAAMSGISVHTGNISLEKAPSNGTANMVLDPIRSTLYRLRHKLASFKIALLSVNTVGYFLAPAQGEPRQKKCRNGEAYDYEER